MKGIAHTITNHINLSVSPHITMVSFPLHSYHPYERLGKIVRDEIYSLCEYSVTYKKDRDDDRLYAYHQMVAYNA